MAREVTEIRSRLDDAFASFLAVYARLGAHRFYGWDKAEDPRNYYGPLLWSEADCALRMAMALETVFPEQVHIEMPVASWTFGDWDKQLDRRQFVDVVVSDLREFVEDETSQARFTSHLHDIFIEAKYFPAGCSKTWRFDHLRKVPSVLADAERLAKHLSRSHCAVAAVLVVDDDGLFEQESAALDWPADVLRLVASPGELARRGMTSATS